MSIARYGSSTVSLSYVYRSRDPDMMTDERRINFLPSSLLDVPLASASDDSDGSFVDEVDD